MQRGDHSSRSRIAPGLKQPTRGLQQRALSSAMHSDRASPPLLFGFAPRGVFRAPDVATRAVGSYPTVSPLPNAPTETGRPSVFPQACRRGTGITGGLFSVALSVAAPAEALSRLFGATPWRYQARCPLPGPAGGKVVASRHARVLESGLSSRSSRSPKRIKPSRRSPGSPAGFSIHGV
jgi:hypothetical protein